MARSIITSTVCLSCSCAVSVGRSMSLRVVRSRFAVVSSLFVRSLADDDVVMQCRCFAVDSRYHNTNQRNQTQREHTHTQTTEATHLSKARYHSQHSTACHMSRRAGMSSVAAGCLLLLATTLLTVDARKPSHATTSLLESHARVGLATDAAGTVDLTQTKCVSLKSVNYVSPNCPNVDWDTYEWITAQAQPAGRVNTTSGQQQHRGRACFTCIHRSASDDDEQSMHETLFTSKSAEAILNPYLHAFSRVTAFSIADVASRCLAAFLFCRVWIKF